MTDYLATDTHEHALGGASSRRGFLKVLGGAAAGTIALAAAGCDSTAPIEEADVLLDFSTDVGVLNYAYALEQLEAAFYAEAAANAYAGISADEQAVIEAIAAHEDIHRLTLDVALGDNAIPGLTPDFSRVDFSSRDSVLGTAQVFEDLGVSAYNGAGKYLQSATFLAAAGSIVSVEARHAAAIRDLILGDTYTEQNFGGSLAGDYVVNAQGLDVAFNPVTVLQAADPFIMETIAVTGL